MCEFRKCLIFEKPRYCRPVVQGKSLISVSYSFSVIQIVAVSTQQVMLIYSSLCVSVYLSHCAVCVSVCVCARACEPYHLCEISSEINTLLHKPYSKAQGTKARKV